MAPPRFPLTTVASGRVADVDTAGRIELVGAGWSASWWVAEGDRWRRPEAEAAVRSRLVDEAAVVETSMRVGGGDVRSTARAFVPVGSVDAAVGVDIANDTPIPVAVALVVGPVRHARLRRGPRAQHFAPTGRGDRIDVKNGEAAALADARAQQRHAASIEDELLQFDFLIADRHAKLVERANRIQGFSSVWGRTMAPATGKQPSPDGGASI